MTQLSDSGSRWSSATPSPAVMRAATILAVLSKSHGNPISVGQLAGVAKIPRSSAANICAALCLSGMLIETEHGFLLGPALVELGQSYLASLDPLRNFTIACQNLPGSLSETIQLATLDGMEVMYLGRHDGNQPIQIASRVGLRLPANCTALGKAMLASLDPEESRARLRKARPLPALTRHSKTSLQELDAELERIRRDGYAIDDEETTEGLLCVGMVVPNMPTGAGLFGVSITTLRVLATPTRIAQLVQELTVIAAAVSKSSA